jgi:hypothetical protein
MQRVVRLTITALMSGAVVLIVPGTGSAAGQPNDSVFFYKSGTAMTGTIHNGTFTPVAASVDVGAGWTAATLGRDTLVLLNTSNGHMRFGTLTAGNYTFVTDNISIKKNFTKLTASCDSILLYSPSNGKVVTTKLGGGSLDAQHLHSYTVVKNFTSVNSSCNTVTFLNSKGSGIIGTLTGGRFTKKGSLATGFSAPQVAHTDSSFLRFTAKDAGIEAGTSNNGVEHVTFGPKGTTGVTKIAGTATSVLAYDAGSGKGATAELVNGVVSNSQSESTLGTGWQLIVGGR